MKSGAQKRGGGCSTLSQRFPIAAIPTKLSREFNDLILDAQRRAAAGESSSVGRAEYKRDSIDDSTAAKAHNPRYPFGHECAAMSDLQRPP